MYINQIELKNYRSFHQQTVDFSKITLLLGPNSGGKTSLIAALLSALQSERFPQYFSPNGNLIETGDYRELIASHSVGRQLSVALCFRDGEGGDGDEYRYSGTYVRDVDTNMPILHSASVIAPEIRWEASRFRTKYKVSWAYLPEHDGRADIVKKGIPQFAGALQALVSSLEKVQVSALDEKRGKGKEIISTKQIDDSAGEYESDLNSLNSVNSFKGSIWASIALTGSNLRLMDFKKKFVYIGSHRIPPQRTYYHVVGSDMKVGVCGQNAVEQMLAWKNAKSKKLVGLAQTMKKLGLASSVTTNKLAGGRFEVRVTVPGSRVSSSLSDVGFGVNQLLPLMVAEYQLPESSTIAVSQPETHLHPKVQAELASHFADQVKNRKFRYIVETHSEYIINRMRRLIRKGDLNPEDVAVYYVEPSALGASVHNIIFEKSGKIAGAPKGFFDTYQVDVLNIALQR